MKKLIVMLLLASCLLGGCGESSISSSEMADSNFQELQEENPDWEIGSTYEVLDVRETWGIHGKSYSNVDLILKDINSGKRKKYTYSFLYGESEEKKEKFESLTLFVPGDRVTYFWYDTFVLEEDKEG